MGFLLSDRVTVGVHLNDNTVIMTQHKSAQYTYLKMKPTITSQEFQFNTLQEDPEIARKVDILLNFKAFLLNELGCATNAHYSALQPAARIEPSALFVKRWRKQGGATLFNLSNGLIQVEFPDEVALYIDKKERTVCLVQASLYCPVVMTNDEVRKSDNQLLQSKLKMTKCIVKNRAFPASLTPEPSKPEVDENGKP